MSLKKPVQSGLARDVLVLAIALVKLVTAIITLVSGATNYGVQCLARTFTRSRSKTAARSLFRRLRAETPATKSSAIYARDGGYPHTFITCGEVVTLLRWGITCTTTSLPPSTFPVFSTV